jgi:hypothetical protein
MSTGLLILKEVATQPRAPLLLQSQFHEESASQRNVVILWIISILHQEATARTTEVEDFAFCVQSKNTARRHVVVAVVHKACVCRELVFLVFSKSHTS